VAHEVESMAYANAVPWHGLGARVDGDISVGEMLEAAGLNWEVKLLPTFASDPDDPETVVELPRRALVRSTDRKVLTVTGPQWKPLQNADMLGFMKRYVEAGGAKLETAGSLRGGKTVWGLARLNHSFEVTPGDRVKGYLLITSPHEVGRAITVKTTSVRVVCANTLAMADLHSETNYSQSHLKEFDFSAAHERVQMAHESLAEAERRAKTLDRLRLSMEDAVRKVFVPAVMPELLKDEEAMEQIMIPESQPTKVMELLESLINAPGARPETGWGVLNAVTHWADHVNGRTPESRLTRAWLGDTARAKVRAEELLMELADA
jgi:phage/plasmid-like protein (TIGR03299 family)